MPSALSFSRFSSSIPCPLRPPIWKVFFTDWKARSSTALLSSNESSGRPAVPLEFRQALGIRIIKNRHFFKGVTEEASSFAHLDFTQLDVVVLGLSRPGLFLLKVSGTQL